MDEKSELAFRQREDLQPEFLQNVSQKKKNAPRSVIPDGLKKIIGLEAMKHWNCKLYLW